MKIVVVGSKGMLGQTLVKFWNDPKIDARIAARTGKSRPTNDVVVPLNLPEFDVCSRLFVVETISDFRPDVVVNASGVNLIDWLETRPNTARNLHGHGVANLKEAVRRVGAKLVQFGCGEVFYRSRLTDETDADAERSADADDLPIRRDAPAFSELDAPNPRSVYAKTKLESERIASEAPKSLVLRTSSLFGETTEFSSGNLVESLLKGFRRTRRVSVLNDKIVEPAWTVDVLCALKTLLNADATGLYHLSGDSRATPFEVAEFLKNRCGLKKHEIVGISTADYGVSAPHTAFSALRSVRLDALDGVYRLPDWKTALGNFLDWRQGAF